MVDDPELSFTVTSDDGSFFLKAECIAENADFTGENGSFVRGFTY